ADVTSGSGDIVITFEADEAAGAGRHQLVLENRHQKDIASYLVNALFPADATVRIVEQERNVDQSHYVMTYSVGQDTIDRASGGPSSDEAVVKTYAWHGLRHIL